MTAPLQRGKTSPNECPGYDTKQSDGDVPVMLGLWGMQSTPSLPLLRGRNLALRGSAKLDPIYGLDRTNGILMLT